MADVANTSGKSGDRIMLSNEDKARMDKLTSDWNAANAAGDTAKADSIHQQAEAIRANYGYSGGADGGGLYITGNNLSRQPNSMEQYIQDMYSAQQAAYEAELKTAYDKNIAALDAAAGKIPELYRTAKNNAAGESAVAGANFNEYAAAQGLGSGSGTQAQLARSNALAGTLSGMDAQQASALKDIENERVQLQQSYANAIAQARQSNKAALADALYNELLRLEDEYNNYADRERQWRYQLEQDEYSRMLNEAKLAAQYGDTSKLAAMGILTGNNYTPKVDEVAEPESVYTITTPTAGTSYDPVWGNWYNQEVQKRSIEMMLDAGQIDSKTAQALLKAISAQ